MTRRLIYCPFICDRGQLTVWKLQLQREVEVGVGGCCNVFSSVVFAKHTPRLHASTWHISSQFLPLMRTELHFLAVIVCVYSPPLSPQISFVGPGGLPIVLSASPLCMTVPSRRCSAIGPIGMQQAPLHCGIRRLLSTPYFSESS